ncbi:MAG: indole-3-glycerol-phosphate synthase, partial [Candidatus Omnitrophica bacterium]|nr:indole-3-glycerol-phosphate synthase [Candidatus Omnitrophota bacterium]
TLPVLRKDFIIDTYQILESALYDADSVLLIARILEEKTLRDCISICKDFDMTALVEVHSINDLDKALSIDADVIGINNRDLDTLEVDLKTTEHLIKFIPKGVLKISESGISTRKDIKYLKSLGVDAVLIGEALLKSKDIKKKIRELFGRR